MLQSAGLGEEGGKELWGSGGRGRGRDGGSPGEEERGRLLDRLEGVGRGGETGEAQAVPQQRRPQLRPGGGRRAGCVRLVCVVDEVAAGAVRAEPDGVEGAARLRLVLGVSAEASQLVQAVGELALGAVLAGAALFEGAAQLRLVAAGDVRRRRRPRGGQGGGRGQRGVADAQARRRKQQRRRGHVAGLVLSDVSLDHADRAVHPEGDVAEQGAGQRPVPLLTGGQVQTPEGRLHRLSAAAVELGVGEGHGAEGMASLEAENSLTVLLRAGGQLCCFQVLQILTNTGQT